ncbi:uncharacterized protein LOC130621146 isoform X2 [Hydractinia symbiolongicarpus]|nr:uncharacterized protein LOC130621146 isoform X2 [Hydractinia symbiolongicarpus]
MSEILEVITSQLSRFSLSIRTFKDAYTNMSELSATKSAASRTQEPKNRPIMTSKTSKNTTHARSRFSRYSRHAMTDVENDLQQINRKKESALLRKLCINVCGQSNEIVHEIISNVVETAYKNHVFNLDSNEAFQSFVLNRDNIIIEPLIGISQSTSSVYNGIIIPCDDWYIVDVLKRLEGLSIKVALVNNISYGNMLPDSKDLRLYKITSQIEEVSFDAKQKQFTACPSCLVFYRGEVKKDMKSTLDNQGVLLISVSSYNVLFSLSTMLSCDILFEFNDLAVTAAARVSVILQRDHTSQSQKRIFSIKNKLSYQLLVQSAENTKVHFYSLLLCSRTLDLYNVLSERIHAYLAKTNCCLRGRSLIKGNGFAERKAVELITTIMEFGTPTMESETLTKESSLDKYEVPHWFKFDVSMYKKLICERIITVFEDYAEIFEDQTENLFLNSLPHRVALWRNSFDCVSKILFCRKINTNF